MTYCAPYRWERGGTSGSAHHHRQAEGQERPEDRLFEECRKLVGPTLAEEGCINYDMHRSVEDPGLIMFYENWTNRPLWERHMESPHLQQFSANTDDIVEVWELFQGEKVEGA